MPDKAFLGLKANDLYLPKNLSFEELKPSLFQGSKLKRIFIGNKNEGCTVDVIRKLEDMLNKPLNNVGSEISQDDKGSKLSQEAEFSPRLRR